MSKDDLISQFKSSLDSALSALVDGAAAMGAASVQAPDVSAQIDQATADLHAQIDDLTSKFASDEAKLAAADAMKASISAKFAEIEALINPPPVVAPAAAPDASVSQPAVSGS